MNLTTTDPRWITGLKGVFPSDKNVVTPDKAHQDNQYEITTSMDRFSPLHLDHLDLSYWDQ